MTEEEAKVGLEKKMAEDRIKRQSVMCPLLRTWCNLMCESWIDATIHTRVTGYETSQNRTRSKPICECSYRDGYCNNFLMHKE